MPSPEDLVQKTTSGASHVGNVGHRGTDETRNVIPEYTK
jgi:hypothetical protein